jgi:6-phospho-3-hexuloisomerase
LLIATSGSGKIKITLNASSTAKEIGTHVIALTSYPEFPLGKLADLALLLVAEQNLVGQQNKTAWSGRFFVKAEPCLLCGQYSKINLDIPWYHGFELMHKLGKTENEMMKLHATIE